MHFFILSRTVDLFLKLILKSITLLNNSKDRDLGIEDREDGVFVDMIPEISVCCH